MANSLVVPLVLWGHNPPTHRICSVLITPDCHCIVTGCRDGQLCIWSYKDECVTAKLMLFGHTSSITAMASIPCGKVWKRQHIVSASDGGEICLWDLVDGRCLEQSRLPGSPMNIIAQDISMSNQLQSCVLCYGQFSEISILSASTLTVLLTLSSRIYPDWFVSALIKTHSELSESCNVIGLTVGGMLKVWRLHKSSSQSLLYEEESKQINCPPVVTMKASTFNSNLLLLVSSSGWQVCDSEDYSVLCSVKKFPYLQWLGGDFLSSDMVVVWDRNGDVSIYKLPFSYNNQETFRSSLQSSSNLPPQLIQSFSLVKQDEFLLPPAACLHHLNNDAVQLVMGSCNGTLAVASLVQNNLNKITTSSLKGLWDGLDKKPFGIIDQLRHSSEELPNITASLFVIQYCYLCCGSDDGSIIVVSAAKTCKANLLEDEHNNRIGWPPHRTLRGHRDRVMCLLYPHQDAPERYSPQFLVSGSADFSVIVWDIIVGTLLHSFHVHGGELTQLIIPPDGCNQRVNHSICSIASDHSVALLNLRDRKCVLLASRHPAPVTAIRWRPDDDFMIISCADATVFIWQMETGSLDRFEQGAIAADIISACDDLTSVKMTYVTHNAVNLSQALKSRSLSAFKAVAQQGLKSLIEGLDSEKQSVEVDEQAASNSYRAMLVSPLRASPLHDNDSHIIFFNTEALIAKLLMEHSLKSKIRAKQIDKRSDLSPSLKNSLLNSLIKQVRSQFLDDENESASEMQASKRNKKQVTPLNIDSAIDIAQIIISCIHAWGLDSDIDKICKERLGLLVPRSPVSFGLLSQHGHMALLLPKSQNEQPVNQTHWRVSSSLTTQHLVSIISIANTMMELPYACFQTRHMKHHLKDIADPGKASQEFMNSVEQSQVKQGWSLLATLHCVLLPERMDRLMYKPPKLELLARRWQDRCLELREASQALMLAELRQMGAEGRRKVVETWSRHVPDYIFQATIDLEQTDSPVSYMAADEFGDRSSVTSDELITNPQLSGNKLSYEIRRRHATAIVILGVVGSEFGQELEPRRAQRLTSDVPEGFGLSDYSLARHTCKALVYLLLQPASAKLPAHIPIRRAAIDLLGRGFTVWEPYMEVASVLLGLLELCESYSHHIASIQSGLPLTAEADSCRSAHHALCLIATARPLTFVTTIAREVARYNAAAANPQHQALLASSVLVRAKSEVLRIIELLADRMVPNLSNVLVEVVDVVLFCIDVSVLRASFGLLEAVPALSNFHTISYDARSRRVAVAGPQDSLVLYDIRTCKHQTVPRSEGKITALCFSPDGKYLCVYSAPDNHMGFWITATSLFGMLQSQVKCVKTLSPLHSSGKSGQNPPSKAVLTKLVWVNNRSVVLLTSDGAEHRFHI